MPESPARIEAVLDDIGPIVIACSGGIDSMLLAILAHRRMPDKVVIAHAISPAVPDEGTKRVREWAGREGWSLRIVRSGEFADESYLSNPVNRCYFCKSNLYASLDAISAKMGGSGTIVSGANLDDLGEYRPGLIAASEKSVRHPWVEADIGKVDIRALARDLDLPFAELPASPCLASRLYTGTRVTPERLRCIHDCEALIRQETGIEVVRCRIQGAEMIIELQDADRDRLTEKMLLLVREMARSAGSGVEKLSVDAAAYKPGRAFVGAK